MIAINPWFLWNCCNCEVRVSAPPPFSDASCVCFYARDRRCKTPWTKPERDGPASSSPTACPPSRTLTLSPSCPGASWSRRERTTSSWPWREPTISWLPREHQSANCSGKRQTISKAAKRNKCKEQRYCCTCHTLDHKVWKKKKIHLFTRAVFISGRGLVMKRGVMFSYTHYFGGILR